ncbi:MAG TPA: zinc-binding dehydrogenase [Anaerolineaceae bacterium]|nr:zinc-binding dehydrogenase [Anaerolineaceae bacterium]
MLGIHFLGQGCISVDEMPIPKPSGRWVVVQTRSATICGTDRENLMSAGQKTVPGHESAGVVVAVDQPARLKPGDRVAINCHVTCGHCEHCLRGDLYFCDQLAVIGFDYDGGFEEYMLVPEASCIPIPGDITFEQASLMVDMLGTPFRAVKRAHLVPGQKIAIWGAGPIGLGALMSAKRFGVEVASIDMSPYRCEMAAKFGPDLIINPAEQDVGKVLKEWTNGRGIDVGFDCVGSESVCQQVLMNIKRRGTLAVVGVSHHLALNPWEQLINNETTIYGSRNFNTGEFDEMIGLIRTGLSVDKVITHRFAYADAEQAFSIFRQGNCGKVIFTGAEKD